MIAEAFASVWALVVVNPLFKLFLRGPSFVGGWGGRPNSEICSAIGAGTAAFWEQAPEQCASVIQAHFDERVVFVETALHFASVAVLLFFCASFLAEIPRAAARGVWMCAKWAFWRPRERVRLALSDGSSGSLLEDEMSPISAALVRTARFQAARTAAECSFPPSVGLKGKDLSNSFFVEESGACVMHGLD